MKTAVLVGATGLIGQFLLERLLAASEYSSVIAIGRSEPKIASQKLTWIKSELDQLSKLNLKADDFFCTLGSTIKKAGSQEQFRMVDFTAVVEFAKLAQTTSASHFCVVSALGANKNSKVFYNQVKGEMEEALQNLKLKRLSIFRPSLLIGPRVEIRRGEKLGAALAKVIAPIMLGPLKKYLPIEARVVARAMFQVAQGAGPVLEIFESDAI